MGCEMLFGLLLVILEWWMSRSPPR